jgi:hypothetical protein
MGICTHQRDFISENVLNHALGKKMLELGNQVINPELADRIDKEMGIILPRTPGPDRYIPGRILAIGKSYYTALGYNHTSIDTNGYDGSLPLDLTKCHPQLNDTFFIVTDHGTIEHIPGIHQQYLLFKNLYEWGAEGCVYGHCVPMGHAEHNQILGYLWPRHGFFGYSSDFWNAFIDACKYKISKVDTVPNMATGTKHLHYSAAAYIKTKDSIFLDFDKFSQLYDLYVTNFF